MSESYIQVGVGTTFVGPDATKLYAATVLKSAINFYLKTGLKINRAYTPKVMRDAASKITGKAYKRTELANADADLKVWCDNMRMALPVVLADGK